MLIVLVCKLYNFFDTPEGFISYASEPNKENLTGDGSQYVYRSLADKVHDDIKKIDEDIKKLDPNSINYLKDKEKLEMKEDVVFNIAEDLPSPHVEKMRFEEKENKDILSPTEPILIEE